MTIWFDVEDLVHYFRSGNKRISGIQRLSFEIFRASHAMGREEIGFLRHGARMPALLPVAWADLVADFGGDDAGIAPSHPEQGVVANPAVTAGSLPRRIARRLLERLPPDVRRPLVLAIVMQAQVVLALAEFIGQALLLPVRRGASWAWTHLRPRRRAASTSAPAGSFEALARPGDTLLVLGAPWNRERYSDIARHIRDEKRMRFGVLVHDLVPIRHPEWCFRGVPKQFREWYLDVLPFCDVVFANSHHTARDVEAYVRESGIALNGAVQTLPIGCGFGTAAGAAASARLPTPGSYVLFVSTLEARKNHALLVRVWSRLLAEVAEGGRAAETVPDLVFAGRIGWLVADLLGQLDHTRWLGGRIKFVRDPSDAELRALYAGCLFTVFPSLHEGWGLPVTESLAMGKPCLSSHAASLMEAGGELCRYFDPESASSAYGAIAAILDDREGLAAWEARVRREFRPLPWDATAGALLDASERLDAVKAGPMA